MSKVLIIPDIHGRTFWKEAVNKFRGRIIFLGDYLDPYTYYENIDSDIAIENFKDILDFAESNPQKVTLLLGNHDCGYIFDNFLSCRQDYQRYDEIRELYKKHWNLFKLGYKQNKCLFTHAGVTKDWWKLHFGKKQFNILLLNDLLKENEEWLNEVSEYRGGLDLYGSVVWAHIYEHKELTFEGIYQIFGHTMYYKPIIREHYAMLDCKQAFIVDTETTEIFTLEGETVTYNEEYNKS